MRPSTTRRFTRSAIGALYLLADPRRRWRAGLAAEFCVSVAGDELRVIEITPHDYRQRAGLLAEYSSLRLQAVDACVIALDERLDLHEVAALCRRDVQVVVVAPRHLPKGSDSSSEPLVDGGDGQGGFTSAAEFPFGSGRRAGSGGELARHLVAGQDH
jgi:hypothetical protein